MSTTSPTPSQTLSGPRPAVYACASPTRLPEHVRVLFAAAGRHFAAEGYRLRLAPGVTGGAGRALASTLGGSEEELDVLLPWPGYQPEADYRLEKPPAKRRLYAGEADRLAACLCPEWRELRGSVRRLEAVRVASATGGAGHPPARFLLLWTPGGAQRPEEILTWTQGAAASIRAAAHADIPILNVGCAAHRERLEAMLGEDLPAGTAPARGEGRLGQAEAREAFADMHAKAKARREAEKRREEENKIEVTPIPKKKSAPPHKKTETAGQKEKKSSAQGRLFG